MAKHMAFYVDLSGCTGCKACQIACKDRHNLPVGVSWLKVIEHEGGQWISKGDVMVPHSVFLYYVPIVCNHCEKPACIEACPEEAIIKRGEDGIVLIEEEDCSGCRVCEDACPYGALQFHEEIGKMTKCTLCHDLMEEGENPVCVDACTMRVLRVGELEELQKEYGFLNQVEPLPDPEETRPALVLTPPRL